ncbi:ABC transporter permease [Sesbania bispinosa]|nr:ABC transporter permease [Sesbania bispinosa]
MEKEVSREALLLRLRLSQKSKFSPGQGNQEPETQENSRLQYTLLLIKLHCLPLECSLLILLFQSPPRFDQSTPPPPRGVHWFGSTQPTR